jgi:hypothetical protein
MSLTKTNNAFLAFLIERDETIFHIIATEYNLDELTLKKKVMAGLDDAKFKPIKPRAKQPKETTKDKVVGGAKKKSCGYLVFSEHIRSEATKLLIENEDERTFVNKKGETIVVDVNDFVKGVPKFMHITKKCGSMWINLPQEEKDKWNTRAAEGYTTKKNGVVKIDIEIKEIVETPEAIITSENSDEEPEKIVKETIQEKKTQPKPKPEPKGSNTNAKKQPQKQKGNTKKT